MALATLHLAILPALAGLVAGTGAVATYVSAPAEPAAAVERAVPCSEQTWPNIDRACLSTDAQPRQVRVVTAPRREELFDVRWDSATSQGLLPPAFPGMTTHDGVLRGPQQVDTSEKAAAPPREKRSDAKPEKRKRSEPRVTKRLYVVPAEDAGDTRQVYVVRPQPVDFLR